MANNTTRIDLYDIIGQKFGMLTVTRYLSSEKHKGYVNHYYECRCECGNTSIRRRAFLTNETTKYPKNCGCFTKTIWPTIASRSYPKHGLSTSRLYNIYRSMKKRCTLPSCDSYYQYGGRGISICEEWLDTKYGFINFSNWAFSNGYIEQDDTVEHRDKLSLERKDVNGNYSPDNCEWIPLWKQGLNRRNSRKLVIGGTEYQSAKVAHIIGCNPQKILDCKHNKKECWSDAAVIFKLMHPEIGLHMDIHGKYRDKDGFEVMINIPKVKNELDTLLNNYRKENNI